MSQMNLKEADASQVFKESGVAVAEWARSRGYNPSLVYRILAGQQKCMRGQSHQIAVELGIKRGISGGLDYVTTKLRERVNDAGKLLVTQSSVRHVSSSIKRRGHRE